jgi:dienelactone hydrolase
MSFAIRAPVALVFACSTATSLVAQTQRPTDQWVTKPVDDRTFATYLEFFTYDSTVPFDVRITSSEVLDGLLEERLSFTSNPGMRVTARTYRTSAGTTRGGLVLVHGGVPNGKDEQRFVGMNRVLARAGWTVLAIDLLYFGERNTGLFQTFDAQEKADKLYNRPSLYLEFAIQTVKDIGRAYDVLVERYDVAPNRIALVGFSRGAQMSMIAGGADRRFAAVALLHGGHFDALEHGHLPAACGANYIGRINPRPLLMLNGEADMDYLPAVSVRPLQQHLGPESTIRWTDAGHGITTEEDLNVLVDWLRKVIPE